ncbi:MAG: hypothetical protein HY960_08305 [Ignavibacteriae bacterium]|nr:hypothetical protein [Ignavibacteriota bacterium]
MLNNKQYITYLFFLFLFPTIFWGNEKVLAFYMEKNVFLLPYIESQLQSLRLANDTTKLFKKIINLNRYQDEISDQVTMRSVIDFYAGKTQYLDLSEKAKKEHENINKELKSYNSFLNIKVNQLNDLLEYQFFLYEVLPTDNKSELRVKSIRQPLQSKSIFINPSSPKYLSDIQNALKQLFPESDSRPIAVISLKGLPTVSNNVYFFGVGDTVNIEASNSIDFDTPRENLQFFWRQINDSGGVNVPLDVLVPIDPHSIEQHFVVHKKVKYKLGLKIFDGVNESDEETIYIQSIDKPLIYIYPQDYNFFKRNSIIQLFENDSTISSFSEELLFSTSSEFDNPKLNFTKDDSTSIDISSFDYKLKKEDNTIFTIDYHTLLQHGFTLYNNNDSLCINYSNESKSRGLNFTTEKIYGGFKTHMKGNLEPGEHFYWVYADEYGVVGPRQKLTINYTEDPFLEIGIHYSDKPITAKDTSISVLKQTERNIEYQPFVVLYPFDFFSLGTDLFWGDSSDAIYSHSFFFRYNGYSTTGRPIYASLNFMKTKIYNEPAFWLVGLGFGYHYRLISYFTLGLESRVFISPQDINYKNTFELNISIFWGMGYSQRN